MTEDPSYNLFEVRHIASDARDILVTKEDRPATPHGCEIVKKMVTISGPKLGPTHTTFEQIAKPEEKQLMRAGDRVKHKGTGETWVVAYVDGDYMSWCGWPEGEACTADCELVKACTDAEHLKWLQNISKSSGKRARMAQIELAHHGAGIRQTANPLTTPMNVKDELEKLAKDCEECAEDAKNEGDAGSYRAWLSAAYRIRHAARRIHEHRAVPQVNP